MRKEPSEGVGQRMCLTLGRKLGKSGLRTDLDKQIGAWNVVENIQGNLNKQNYIAKNLVAKMQFKITSFSVHILNGQFFTFYLISSKYSVFISTFPFFI